MSTTYEDFVVTCGSIAELKFKILIYGEGWTPYDWAIYLPYSASYTFKESAGQTRNDILKTHDSFVRDIFETIDTGNDLDSVITNRIVVSELISLINYGSNFNGETGRFLILSILAHIYKKFPDMWNMSWMWKNHRIKTSLRTGRGRTHIFEYMFPGKSVVFYESPEFRHEFISRYFNCWKNII